MSDRIRLSPYWFGYCSHNYHKIENYFIFEQVKKKMWANLQRIIGLFTQKIAINSKKYRFGILDPRSGKKAPDPGSATLLPEKKDI
jgi:hypothetical protein